MFGLALGMKNLIISLLLISNQSFAHTQVALKERLNEDNLTKEFAELRKSQIFHSNLRKAEKTSTEKLYSK